MHTIPVCLDSRPRSPLMSQASPSTENRSQDSLPAPIRQARPRVLGKFLYVGDEKLYVRGVTYGTFRPDEVGNEFHDPELVERDFAQMAAHNINAIRTYTVPPPWLLDAALRHGIYVMVGIPWEQHVAFLGSRRRMRAIEEGIRAGVRACAGHPAVLCYSIGNEIPSSIVRWHGRRRVVRYLHRLYLAAKSEDPQGLVTYVNYPSTEYLDLPFLDFMSFNVYLEEQQRLEAYLARLQNLAGERPLLMAELGLDSRRHGEVAQARTLDWQIRTAFSGGCAGAFVFAWTDEWHRGGHDVEDWDFGLTGRERRAKPALATVRRAFDEVPFPRHLAWPRISVVVCSYNGSATLRDCCEGLLELDYPDYEVLVVDDGSTDATSNIALEYGFRLIRTENLGLSNARNVGMEAATGEIIAYTDDDARPDPQWLTYVAHTFMTTEHAAVGGPNIAPAGDGPIARCVANAPGGPAHVLLSDSEAEHIPGCNMAFRKSCLQAIGGFDPQFRVAGDDVDVCWRLRERGWTLGFHPAAVVWHHRRNSVRAYWKQQAGYGKAEALLESKWPEKYNSAGHVSWHGRLYGSGVPRTLPSSGGRIYGGVWGSAPFQRLYEPAPSSFRSLPLLPEWYLLIAALMGLVALGISWSPLLLALPLLALAVALPVGQAVASAARAPFQDDPPPGRWRLRVLTAVLHLLQPFARLWGRLRHGLTPWRRRGLAGPTLPRPQTISIWAEEWQSSEAWLASVETDLRRESAIVVRGGEFDRWDLEVRGGLFGAARMSMAIEEHGAGRQMALFRTRPRLRSGGRGLIPLLGGLVALVALAAAGDAWLACFVLSGVALVLALRMLHECATATAALNAVLHARPGVVGKRVAKAQGAYRRLLEYAFPYRRTWALIVAVTLATTLTALLQPWPMKVVVDNVIGGRPASELFAQALAALPGAGAPGGLLAWAALAGIVLFALNSVLDVVLTFAWIRAGQRMVYDLAADLFRRAQQRSLLFHSRNAVGDLMSRIMQDSWSVHTVVDTLIFAPGQALVMTVGLAAIMFSMDAGLTLLALVVAPLMVAASLVLGKPIRAAAHVRRKTESRIHSHVQQILSGIPVVQSFAQEEREGNRFREFTRAAIRAHQRSTVVGNVYKLGSGLITSLGTALILWIGAHHVLEGALSVGGLLVFLVYLNSLQGQLKTFAGIYSTLQAAGAGVDRVMEILEGESDVPEKPDALPLAAVKGHVDLENVTFGYEPERPVLSNVSLSVQPGETIAVVGPTGAGKSTLAGLIARFFDPWEGSVSIDGCDLRDVESKSLREQVAVVLQEPFLMPVTIAENIAYGRPGASRGEIEAAARAANAHLFIEQLPDGYDTLVGERGATLSGGEKQRLSIARALLKDAPILVLDEPTSALDAETEHLLMEALGRLTAGRTTIIIAHRLSTVRHAGRIVVLRDGRITETGTHEDLLARGGYYSHLLDTQLGVRQDAGALDVAG
ncbi:MAG TPA: ABC transporter transmembrane domain-containing protein [Chloroflexia bacterium]|nr:ABC transporter transmembrane domain-containing protein [Chloroflexia bacterium]